MGLWRCSQVPATDWEALKSPLMGLFEKRRAAKFFSFCQQYDERNPQVWGLAVDRVGRSARWHVQGVAVLLLLRSA